MRSKTLLVLLVLLAVLVLALFAHGEKRRPGSTGAWDIYYSSGVSLHALSGALWYFDFPVCPSTNPACNWVGYVAEQWSSPIVMGSTLSMTFSIPTTGSPVFNYMLESSNTCVYPAHVRFYLEHSHLNNRNEFDRWWSNPVAAELTPSGITNLSVPLTPDQWSSVYGKFGNSSPSAMTGFASVLQSPGHVGMTFGGGCFFGHGVSVSNGTAQFVLDTFAIQ